MKRLLPFLALWLVTAWCLAQDKKIFPFPILQKQLPNGLTVVTVPYNSPGIASFYIVVRAGSREEVEPGKTGFAHFFEHMMFRGTENYPKEAYEEVLKSLGASSNANTSLDRTMYYITGNASMLEKMFEIESDRFQHLKYSEHDFKTEAGAVKGEYTKNYSDVLSQLSEKTLETAFEKHTYKHTTMGFFKDVVDMPNQYDYSLAFYDRFYRPEYSTIIVVGDVKQEDVNRLAQKYFGSWKHGNYQPLIEEEPKQTATRYVHIKQANYPPLLRLNYKGPAFSNNKDLAALSLLNMVLFTESGDLYQKLVVKEQKLRSLGGNANSNRDPNLVVINASLRNAADMKYVKNELVTTLNAAKNNPIDAKKLADSKSRIRYSLAMALDNPDAIAGNIAQAVWLSGDPEGLNKYYAVLETITAQDIMNAAKKYFVPESLTISTISSSDESPVK